MALSWPGHICNKHQSIFKALFKEGKANRNLGSSEYFLASTKFKHTKEDF